MASGYIRTNSNDLVEKLNGEKRFLNTFIKQASIANSPGQKSKGKFTKQIAKAKEHIQKIDGLVNEVKNAVKGLRQAQNASNDKIRKLAIKGNKAVIEAVARDVYVGGMMKKGLLKKVQTLRKSFKSNKLAKAKPNIPKPKGKAPAKPTAKQNIKSLQKASRKKTAGKRNPMAKTASTSKKASKRSPRAKVERRGPAPK